MRSEWFGGGMTYWSLNAANQQCCWNKWAEASVASMEYYNSFYRFESAYDADNDPSTVQYFFDIKF